MAVSNILFLTYCFISVYSQDLQTAKNLISDLLNGYNKYVRPTNNQLQPVDISVQFNMISINSFKEVDERISVTAGMAMVWTDASLSWNPASYGGIGTVHLPKNEIWIPLLYLLNTPEDMKSLGDDADYLVIVLFNGTVVYAPGMAMEATCPTDVSKFPFDSQTCVFEFITWNMDLTAVTLSSPTNSVYFPYFTDNSDWELTDHSTSIDLINSQFYVYNVKFTIERHPKYYTVVIILPTILFCLLNPIVFFLPVESGERVSVAITILLSYAIFLTLVCDSIPATSNPMCALLVVMIIIIANSGLILIFIIISTRYYFKDEIRKLDKFSKLIMILTKRKKVTPVDEKCFSGKKIAQVMDRLFCVISYVIIVVVVFSYLIFISV